MYIVINRTNDRVTGIISKLNGEAFMPDVFMTAEDAQVAVDRWVAKNPNQEGNYKIRKVALRDGSEVANA